MTCSAHTLNLVATTDTTKITDLNYKKISKSAFGKLSSFWNLLSRSIVASDLTFKICQCKLTIALDKLQGEKSCYLIYVAPTVITIRNLLMEQNHLVYCASLSKAIIKSLEKRYAFIFDLKDPKSKPYILAAVSHPKFKMVRMLIMKH